MNFKNELERQCFEIAEHALGANVTIEHNKSLEIESALFPEVASFKGPPTKEVDVLVAELLSDPRVVLLVSCKSLARPAEPAHIQEWGAVVQTMNRYSDSTLYFGLVLSATGFTDGCEAWGTSHNLGIVPPLKGRRLTFNEDTVLRMFERVLRALQVRARLQVDDLRAAPAFFDFVYRLVADFEGHQEGTADGRYFLAPQGWASSFGEMYSTIGGRKVQELWAFDTGAVMELSGGIAVRFEESSVHFGHDPEITKGTPRIPQCVKNIDLEPCTLELVKSVVVGKSITSAGDFGDYLEIGLDQRFNLGLHGGGFHLISTETPFEQHQL